MGPWRGLLNACANAILLFSIRKKIMRLKGLNTGCSSICIAYMCSLFGDEFGLAVWH